MKWVVSFSILSRFGPRRGRVDGVWMRPRCRDAVAVITNGFVPAQGYNYDETVSTLRYANRAKNIKNKPKINEDPKDAMLREFQDEIARLKAQLQGKGTYDENGEWQGSDSASRGAAAPSRHRCDSHPPDDAVASTLSP